MKTYTNIPKIRRKQQIGMWTSITGLVIMGLSLFISWQPQYASVAWLTALLGIAIATVGTYHVNRWLRPPMPEPMMEETLNRLDAKHVLFNHYGPLPHLLLTPKGLVAIKVKRYEGPVAYDTATNRWRGKFSLGRLYGRGLTAETLGDPSEDLTKARNAVLAWLQRHTPDIADEVPVEAVAFFLNQKGDLSVPNAPIPLAQQASLKRIVQGFFSKEKPLSKEVYNQLRKALEAEVPSGLVQAA